MLCCPKSLFHFNMFSSCRIMNSLDTVLHFSQIFGLQGNERGVVIVEIIFSIVWQLLDSSLDDEGLLQLTPEKKSRWLRRAHDMEIDEFESYDGKRLEHNERLKNGNSTMAVDLIGQFLQNKVTSRILYLARLNMLELHPFKIFFSISHYLLLAFVRSI